MCNRYTESGLPKITRGVWLNGPLYAYELLRRQAEIYKLEGDNK